MEIVTSSASHHAMLFAYVSEETVRAFGEAGEQALVEAVRRYGYQRGRRMGMRADLDGIARNALSYVLYSEWECFPGQVERVDSQDHGRFCLQYCRCPWYTEWSSAGMMEYGKYYCGHVDKAILEGFGAKRGHLASCRIDGAETCDLLFEGPCCTQEAYEQLSAWKFLLGHQAIMPWEYHVGHLYQALRNAIERRFAADGTRALRRALKRYVQQFGQTAGDLVLQYAELDFDVLPPYSAPLRPEQRARRIDRMIETDLLVAGGSGAAVMAAVEAAKSGQQVLLLSKGKIGRSGNMIMAGGGFGVDGHSAKHLLNMEQADDRFDQADLLDSLIKEGFYLSDRALAELYVQDGPEVMGTFLEWAEEAGQRYEFLPSGTWVGSGRSFARAVEQGLRHAPQVRRMEDCVLLDVLTSDGHVSGALALELYSGDLLLIRAKAVILATGGYQPFAVNNTNSDMTGDGQAAALRAGAKLVDMEFMLGMLTALEPAELRGSIYPFVFEFNLPELHYRLLDRNREPLEAEPELATRFRGKKISKLVNSWLFAQAKAEGRLTERGGLYLDYSENPPEVRKAALERFFDRFQRWYPRGCYNGERLDGVVDAIMSGRPLEVTIGYEYSLGGIAVDAQMQTGVPGLFAAGEVTSGTFGACRAGDGLLEMLVQGRRAGRSAAAFAHRRDCCPIDREQMQCYVDRYLRYFRSTNGVSPHFLFARIQQSCTHGFGMLRSESSLRRTAAELMQLQLQVNSLCTLHTEGRAYNMEWLRAMQCENLLLCCRCGVQAALERRESRGVHIRSDYPRIDERNYWLRYEFALEQGKLVMTSCQPQLDKTTPRGDGQTIPEYLLDPTLEYRR